MATSGREGTMAKSIPPGITPAGSGQDEVVWNVLGHRYFLKAHGANCFCFETFDPPGTFVPLHIHPKQDEFIYMLEGTFDLQLGDAKVQARPGDLVRMPMGVPHAYYNNTAAPTRALFWARRPAQGAVRRASRPHGHRRGHAPVRAARSRLRAIAEGGPRIGPVRRDTREVTGQATEGPDIARRRARWLRKEPWRQSSRPQSHKVGVA
jgi:quercetin dioxygenase-like cupin family protein